MNGTAHLLVDYSSILAFFLMGCVYISIGMFISSLTESQIIAVVGTFGVLLLLILWPSLVNFLPTSAIGSLIGFLFLWTLAVMIVHRITSHNLLAVVLEAVGAIAMVAAYFINKNMFDRLLVKAVEKIAITDVFQNFIGNYIFDLGGLIYYITIIFLLIFLTIQSVEKSRWS